MNSIEPQLLGEYDSDASEREFERPTSLDHEVNAETSLLTVPYCPNKTDALVEAGESQAGVVDACALSRYSVEELGALAWDSIPKKKLYAFGPFSPVVCSPLLCCGTNADELSQFLRYYARELCARHTFPCVHDLRRVIVLKHFDQIPTPEVCLPSSFQHLEADFLHSSSDVDWMIAFLREKVTLDTVRRLTPVMDNEVVESTSSVVRCGGMRQLFCELCGLCTSCSQGEDCTLILNFLLRFCLARSELSFILKFFELVLDIQPTVRESVQIKINKKWTDMLRQVLPYMWPLPIPSRMSEWSAPTSLNRVLPKECGEIVGFFTTSTTVAFLTKNGIFEFDFTPPHEFLRCNKSLVVSEVRGVIDVDENKVGVLLSDGAVINVDKKTLNILDTIPKQDGLWNGRAFLHPHVSATAEPKALRIEGEVRGVMDSSISFPRMSCCTIEFWVFIEAAMTTGSLVVAAVGDEDGHCSISGTVIVDSGVPYIRFEHSCPHCSSAFAIRSQRETWNHYAVSLFAEATGTRWQAFCNGKACTAADKEPPATKCPTKRSQVEVLAGEFFGSVCNVCIWKQQRTQSQVLTSMRFGAEVGVSEGLIFCLPLDDGAGLKVREVVHKTHWTSSTNNVTWKSRGSCGLQSSLRESLPRQLPSKCAICSNCDQMMVLDKERNRAIWTERCSGSIICEKVLPAQFQLPHLMFYDCERRVLFAYFKESATVRQFPRDNVTTTKTVPITDVGAALGRLTTLTKPLDVCGGIALCISKMCEMHKNVEMDERWIVDTSTSSLNDLVRLAKKVAALTKHDDSEPLSNIFTMILSLLLVQLKLLGPATPVDVTTQVTEFCTSLDGVSSSVRQVVHDLLDVVYVSCISLSSQMDLVWTAKNFVQVSKILTADRIPSVVATLLVENSGRFERFIEKLSSWTREEMLAPQCSPSASRMLLDAVFSVAKLRSPALLRVLSCVVKLSLDAIDFAEHLPSLAELTKNIQMSVVGRVLFPLVHILPKLLGHDPTQEADVAQLLQKVSAKVHRLCTVYQGECKDATFCQQRCIDSPSIMTAPFETTLSLLHAQKVKMTVRFAHLHNRPRICITATDNDFVTSVHNVVAQSQEVTLSFDNGGSIALRATPEDNSCSGFSAVVEAVIKIEHCHTVWLHELDDCLFYGLAAISQDLLSQYVGNSKSLARSSCLRAGLRSHSIADCAHPATSELEKSLDGENGETFRVATDLLNGSEPIKSKWDAVLRKQQVPRG